MMLSVQFRSSAVIKKYVNRTQDRIVGPRMIANGKGGYVVDSRCQVSTRSFMK